MKHVRIILGGNQLTIDDKLILMTVKPLFVIFIYYGMFSRFAGFGGLTGGKTAILVTGLLFLVCCYHFVFVNRQHTLSPLFVFSFLFFLVAGLSPLISAFIYNVRLTLIFRFAFEIGIIFVMFFCVYYLLREGLITPKFVVYTIAIVGSIAALQFLTGLVGRINIRRLRGLGGLNYIGNSFAVSAICYVMILYTANLSGYKKYLAIAGMFFSILAMLLSGTRAALIAFVVGLVFYQYFGMKSRQFKKYVAVAIILMLIPIGILAMNFDMTHFFNRFSFDDVANMAWIRFNIYASAVTDLTFVEFLFGRPDLAAFSASDTDEITRYINPHNVFLSLIRFNGIFSFIMFFWLLTYIFSNYLKIYAKNYSVEEFRLTEATILIFLTMSFINVMLSGGKFTRNFYLFIALGYAVGYMDILRKSYHPKEYLKKLL
ncbi:MAG: O-antigen ligase family protein [Balneolaceae bacterium]|nr:O-antigen ligase family protein [Balneolaceae bacterium]